MTTFTSVCNETFNDNDIVINKNWLILGIIVIVSCSCLLNIFCVCYGQNMLDCFTRKNLDNDGNNSIYSDSSLILYESLDENE